MERTTFLLVLKRLFTSKSFYKLIGLLLTASGIVAGSDVLDALSGTLCALVGGCGE